MSGGVEFAAGPRTHNVFPRHWIERGVSLAKNVPDDVAIRNWIVLNMVEDGDPKNAASWTDTSPAGLLRRLDELERRWQNQ